MNKMKDVFVLTIILIPFSINAQTRVKIHVPTAREEAEYIWRTIVDTQFFENNGYQVSLPDCELIDELKEKARANRLSDEDQERLFNYVKESVYNESDYASGKSKIAQQQELIDQMINQLSMLNTNWNFKQFDIYEINLTLYGPGGSYNPEDGSILIYTTPEGRFKHYDNPANTIIHEVVHIGIEESIIASYNVPHALKERIVDTIVSLKFNSDLPDYRIQNMGETRIDKYLKSVLDISDLDIHVQNALDE